jgi:homoserine acetyltransferase
MDARTPWETAVSSLAGQGRPLSNARLLEALKMRALPFHLYSGQKDVMVPTETFREETAVLGARVKYQNFDFSGHEGFYTERQVWDDLISP